MTFTQNRLLAEYIEELYEEAIKKDWVLCENANFFAGSIIGETPDKKASDFLESFHMEELYSVVALDEYFCGIRAEHFCIEVGQSEDDGFGDDVESPLTRNVVVTASHKGQRRTTIFKIAEKRNKK